MGLPTVQSRVATVVLSHAGVFIGHCQINEKFCLCYRYYAIVHPMRAQYTCTISQARKIVITTWVVSFLLGIPMIFTQVRIIFL